VFVPRNPRLAPSAAPGAPAAHGHAPAPPTEGALLGDFTTVLVFLVFGAGFVFLNVNVLSRLLRTSTPNPVKALSYECGEPTYGTSFIRFDIRFYVVALIFLIFDVEVVFLVPWAVAMKGLAQDGLGMLAFVEAFLFVAILSAGLVYVWRKGDIEWIPRGLQQARDAEIARDAADRAGAAAAAVGTATAREA
jgi:NADH-quinone oxidoreductase subunit A